MDNFLFLFPVLRWVSVSGHTPLGAACVTYKVLTSPLSPRIRKETQPHCLSWDRRTRYVFILSCICCSSIAWGFFVLLFVLAARPDAGKSSLVPSAFYSHDSVPDSMCAMIGWFENKAISGSNKVKSNRITGCQEGTIMLNLCSDELKKLCNVKFPFGICYIGL